MISMRKKILPFLVLANILVGQSPLFTASSTLKAEDLDRLLEDTRLVEPGFSEEPERSFYTKEELETLPVFANTIFKNIPEAVFNPPAAAPSDAAHVLTTLSREAAFTSKIIPPETLNDLFDQYISVFSYTDMPYSFTENWLNADISPFFSNGINDFQDRKEAFVEKKVIYSHESEPQTVLFMGDIHGSIHALLRNLLAMRAQGYINDDFYLAKNVHLVFLGDMVDRGLHGIECIYTILKLKTRMWDNVHIVRGNHEDYGLTNRYGFLHELSCKYPYSFNDIYSSYGNFCTSLPSALFLGFYDEIARKTRFMLCCHGGIAPSHDPENLLNDKHAIFQRVEYKNALTGHHLCNAHQYEWNDFCCTRDAEKLGFVDSTDVLSGVSLERIPWKPSERSSEEFPLQTIHRDDLTKILRKNNLFMLMRGHQDQVAPCKVLKDGFTAPVSWRTHIAFKDISTQAFLGQGINLIDAPNCLTLTTASDARGLFAEGFTKVWFNGNFETSRLQVYELNLMPPKQIDWWIDTQRLSRYNINDKEVDKMISLAAESRHGKYLRYENLDSDTVPTGGAGGASGASATVSAGAGDSSVTRSISTFPRMYWSNDQRTAGLFSNKHARAIPLIPTTGPLPLYFGPGTINDAISKKFPGTEEDYDGIGYEG